MEESETVQEICKTCIYRVAAGGRFVCASMKSERYNTAVRDNQTCGRWKKNKRGRTLEVMALEQQGGAP